MSSIDQRRAERYAAMARAEEPPKAPFVPGPPFNTAYNELPDDRLRGFVIDVVDPATWMDGGLDHGAGKIAAVLKAKAGDVEAVVKGLAKMRADGTLVEWLTKGLEVKP